MNSRGSNSIGLGILFVVSGIALLGDRNCKCGCRTLTEHLIKIGIRLVSGPTG